VRTIICIFLCLLFQVLPGLAQEAQLRLELASQNPVQIGDTLIVEVHADSRGLALTSASAYISFDEAIFALVPDTSSPNGAVQPFASGPFLPGQVYENSTAGDAEGGNGLEGFQLNYVAVSGTGQDRPAGRGRGVLARFKLRTVGFPESGASAVRLDASGQRQPLYTTLEEPGLAQRFRVEPLEWIAIDGEGLLPLADLEITLGTEHIIDLKSHYMSQKWSYEDLDWEVWSENSEALELAVVDEKLSLMATSDEGVIAVIYRLRVPDGEVVEGVFSVVINVPPSRLVDRSLIIEEDSEFPRLALAEFIGGEWTEEDRNWSVTGYDEVVAQIEGEDLLLAVPADWNGKETLLVSWCNEKGFCETAKLEIEVGAVNDYPQIATLSPVVVAVGERYRGPILAEVVTDPDHALDELEIDLVGDGGVEVEVVDGVIEIHGVEVGEGLVSLSVVDPLGAQSWASIEVQVLRVDTGPRLDSLSDMELEVEGVHDMVLGVVDFDTPLAELSWSMAIEGSVVAEWVGEGPPHLQLRGLAQGEAIVRIQVRDPEGSVATTAFRVKVEEPMAEMVSEVGVLDLGDEGVIDEVLEVDMVNEGDESGDITEDVLAVDEVVSVDVPDGLESVEEAVDALAVDGVGEVAGSEELGAIVPLKLDDIPDLYLVKGSTSEFLLDDYVVIGGAEQLQWSVAGAIDLEVEISESRRVVVRVPLHFSGREILLFRAEDGEGNSAVDAVRIVVGADDPGVLENTVPDEAVDLPDPNEITGPPEAADGVAQSLELRNFPEVALVAGLVDSALVLDSLVKNGDPQAIVWSLRGGVFIKAFIDAQRRLHIDGTQALQGREVFFLEAQLGAESQQVQLVVSVRAPDFGLKSLPSLRLEAGEHLLDLGGYLEGDFTPDQIEWNVIAPAEIGFEFTGSMLRIITEEDGVYSLVIQVRSPGGHKLEAELVVEVLGALELESLEPESVELGAEEPEVVELETQESILSDVEDGSRIPEAPVIDEPDEIILVDNQPPSLSLSGYLLADSIVEYRLEADEELAEMPILIADGQVLQVEVRGHYYVAHYRGNSGVTEILAVARDRSDNLARTRLSLSIGDGASVLSPDGLLRVQGGEGAVLLYAVEAGYQVDIEPGSTAELVFQGGEKGQGIFRQTVSGWEEIPAQIDGDELYAVVARSGIYRLAKGTANAGEAQPMAYPNPFNAEVVLRYQVEADGPVRVAVYSALGVQVRLLADQIQGAGVRTLRWNGRDQRGFPMASGVYLLVIDANGERRSRKVMLIR